MAVSTPEGADGFGLGVEVIQLGPLTVGQISFAGPVSLVVAELDAYHVSMPTTGRMQARHAGHEVVAGPSTGVVFGPGNPVYTMHDANSAELAVKIERDALEQELAGLLGRPVQGPIDLPPAIDLSGGPGHSWSRLVRLLRDELEYPESLIYQPLIAEQLRSSVLSGLLLSIPHRYHDELTGPATAGPPRAIRRVVDAIHDEPERPFTVADLAAIAGMSVRSLQEGFRRHIGCTPMAYLQRERLLRAHETLRRADPLRMTVAAVAHRWGFAHLGRFASAYRTRFGEPPSDTLRRCG
ncbi:AraC family transcriptional regulator [Actinoplanes sp. CA-142083]|uniref:AraC family transcriptional regulator n=1 Tax=Actinoplanes sp. CA-142083 TaxID=3239903 RepID=UPI003D93194D